MALILNIETSTTLCSVSLAQAGKIISSKEVNQGYTHAENLHVFIENVLAEAGKSPKDLNSIAVGSGPGSYTGLRIGVSAAKGLAYALQIPLIAVNTLHTMAAMALQQIKSDVLFPIEEQQYLFRHIPKSALAELDSFYGHDGFLIETEALTNIITSFFKTDVKGKIIELQRTA